MLAIDVINRYFASAAGRDADAVVALFGDDAVVLDEGLTYQGKVEIRGWWEGPATVFQYTTNVLGIEPAGDSQFVARVRLDGNFPGGTVELNYRFFVDGNRISRLEIAA